MENSDLTSASAAIPPSTPEERTWAMGTHLSGPIGCMLLAALGVPVGAVICPLISWLVKKDQSPYINVQAKEALNANISYLIYMIPIVGVMILMVLTVILLVIAVPLMIAIGIAYFVVSIKAAIAANKGEMYQYPFNLRLIR